MPRHDWLSWNHPAPINFGQLQFRNDVTGLSGGEVAVALLVDDDLKQPVDAAANPAVPSDGSTLLQTCQPVTHAEITERLKDGGHIRGAVLEAQDDSKQPKYAVFLLTNWRKGYCVLHVHWPARPRLFRDLDRLLVLLRFEYGFTGTIALKRASEVSEGKRHWRVTL